MSNLQDLEHCGTVRCGSAWLTAATATPISYKLCTASYARAINIFDLQVLATMSPMSVCGFYLSYTILLCVHAIRTEMQFLRTEKRKDNFLTANQQGSCLVPITESMSTIKSIGALQICTMSNTDMA